MSARSDFWINVVGFEVVWMIGVGGAAHGAWWAGPIAVGAFAAYQLIAPRASRADPPLIALALAIGFVVDSLLARSHLVIYAAPWPSADFAPVWILALWANLALTLDHSLAYLQRRPLLAALFGAIGAPLSYVFAARSWHALTLAEPPATTLLAIAAIWAVATPILTSAAHRFARRADIPRTEPRS